MAMDNLVKQALVCWEKSQLVYLSPSFRSVPEERMWVEKLADDIDLEMDVLNLIDASNHIVIAYSLLTLERMQSDHLLEIVEKLSDRREKISLIKGSFATSMDLGGLARQIKKRNTPIN